MNLHRKFRPQWPKLTVEERRKLLVTLFVVAVLAFAILVALS